MKAHIIAYCCQNLGDDMFVRCLVRRYPDVQFTCNVSPKMNRAFRDEKNLRLPGVLSFFVQRVENKLKFGSGNEHRKRMAQKSDVVIRIGGSIFIERLDGAKRSWKKLHENEYVLGANFGPWKTDSFLTEAKAYFSQCCDVCFRDQFSYALFQPLESIRVAPDLLFGYPYYPKSKVGKGVGISVISTEKRKELKQIGSAYYSVLAAVCDYLIAQGIPVTLFSFCAAEGDMEAVHAIQAKAKYRNKINVVAYKGDIDEVLTAMNACDTIIATRFHAMILGWAMGKKVLPVIYSPKQTHVLHDVCWDGPCWNLLEGEILNLKKIIRSMEGLEPLSNVRELSKGSQMQFSKLDDLFLKI